MNDDQMIIDALARVMRAYDENELSAKERALVESIRNLSIKDLNREDRNNIFVAYEKLDVYDGHRMDLES